MATLRVLRAKVPGWLQRGPQVLLPARFCSRGSAGAGQQEPRPTVARQRDGIRSARGGVREACIQGRWRTGTRRAGRGSCLTPSHWPRDGPTLISQGAAASRTADGWPLSSGEDCGWLLLRWPLPHALLPRSSRACPCWTVELGTAYPAVHPLAAVAPHKLH